MIELGALFFPPFFSVCIVILWHPVDFLPVPALQVPTTKQTEKIVLDAMIDNRHKLHHHHSSSPYDDITLVSGNILSTISQ